MLIVYNGPHPEVVVDELDVDTVIVKGEPVEVPDDLAARLLMQDTWARDVNSLSRDELNAQAADAGVEDPHKLPNKQAVADAIDVTPAADSPAEAPSEPPATIADPTATADPTAPSGATTEGNS